MYVSNVTSQKINDLLTLTFQMNAIMDNYAYNLAYDKMVQTEAIFHERFAHVFPALADQISGVMLNLNVRPGRGALVSSDARIDDLSVMFNEILTQVRKYRQAIIEVINTADYNDDYEIKIVMEDYLHNFIQYINQAEIWAKKAEQYKNNVQEFDNHFKDFTIIA